MENFLLHAGYWALILFGFLEACCVPISSEITFGFAGVLAYQGHLSLALVIILGTLAELAGAWAIPLCRALPLVRAFTSIVAGFAGVPALRFGVLSLIGTVIYATVVSSIGYLVGSAWHRVARDLSVAGYLLAALVVLAIVAFVGYRLRALRRESRSEREAGDAAQRPGSHRARRGG
jgi:membrane protein DedA with SNARE-associated domain